MAKDVSTTSSREGHQLYQKEFDIGRATLFQ
jgi:hypothetical protein